MNKKATFTIEEFRKLPRSVQNEREHELSDHDRFLARIEDWGPLPPASDTIHEITQLIQGDKEKEEEFLLHLFRFGADGIDQHHD